MADLVIKEIFCIIVSGLSAAFYTSGLHVRKGKAGIVFVTMALIFLSHQVIFLPVYKSFEVIFDLLQIGLEFIIVWFVMDDRIVRKITVYVEMNIISGIGMPAGYGVLRIIDRNSGNMLQSNDMVNEAVYYITVVVTMSVAVLIVIMLSNCKKETDNLSGVEMTVCFMLGLLCMAYSLGVTLTRTGESWKIFNLYIIFMGMAGLLLLLLKLNEGIRKKEGLGIKYYILNEQYKTMRELKEKLAEEERQLSACVAEVQRELGELYGLAKETGASVAGEGNHENEIIRLLMEEKRKRAKAVSCNMDMKLHMEENISMKPEDYVSILSNLTDNAIEAVGKADMENRYIKIRGRAQKDEFYFYIENPYEGELKTCGERFLTSKTEGSHGFGMESVREILRGYDKNIRIDTKNGIFKVTIE